jgi:hypothetical protein
MDAMACGHHEKMANESHATNLAAPGNNNVTTLDQDLAPMPDLWPVARIGRHRTSATADYSQNRYFRDNFNIYWTKALDLHE